MLFLPGPRYQIDFPQRPAVVTPNRIMHAELEVVTAKMIENPDEYKAQLSKYNADAQAHETSAINDYINSRIVCGGACSRTRPIDSRQTAEDPVAQGESPQDLRLRLQRGWHLGLGKGAFQEA